MMSSSTSTATTPKHNNKHSKQDYGSIQIHNNKDDDDDDDDDDDGDGDDSGGDDNSDPQDDLVVDIINVDHFDPDQERYIYPKPVPFFTMERFLEIGIPILAGLVIMITVITLVWKTSRHSHSIYSSSSQNGDTTTTTTGYDADDDYYDGSRAGTGRRAPLGPQGIDNEVDGGGGGDTSYIPGPPHSYSHDYTPHRYF